MGGPGRAAGVTAIVLVDDQELARAADQQSLLAGQRPGFPPRVPPNR